MFRYINPLTVVREVFPPSHPIRETLERERYQKLHQVKFRHVLFELISLEEYNWTWQLYPSHIVILKTNV